MIHEDITCVYLTSKRRCSVYDARPLMCRVWGVIKSLSCMHGCIPERWLTPSEFLAIAQELERIGGDLFVTTTEGLKPHKSYREIQQTIPDEQIEAYDERTRGLRALHGGHIIGVSPSGTNEFKWVNVDKPEEEQ